MSTKECQQKVCQLSNLFQLFIDYVIVIDFKNEINMSVPKDCTHIYFVGIGMYLDLMFKSTVMRKTAKAFNISGWLFPSLIAKSKVPVHTYYLPH